MQNKESLNILDKLIKSAIDMNLWFGLLAAIYLHIIVWIFDGKIKLNEKLQVPFYIILVLIGIAIARIFWINIRDERLKKPIRVIRDNLVKYIILIIILSVMLNLSLIISIAISLYFIFPFVSIKEDFYRQGLEVLLAIGILLIFMNLFDKFKSKNKFLQQTFKKQ